MSKNFFMLLSDLHGGYLNCWCLLFQPLLLLSKLCLSMGEFFFFFCTCNTSLMLSKMEDLPKEQLLLSYSYNFTIILFLKQKFIRLLLVVLISLIDWVSNCTRFLIELLFTVWKNKVVHLFGYWIIEFKMLKVYSD